MPIVGPNQTMKPTPKALTHSFPLNSTYRFAHLCRSRPRGSIREQAGPIARQPRRVCHDTLDSVSVPGFPSAIYVFALTHSRRIVFQR
jgi:hypothetical protein